jgi:hypothetical protein
MSVEIGTAAAAPFSEKEYMNGIFIAVCIPIVSRSNFNEEIHIGLLVLILHVVTISCARVIDVSQKVPTSRGERGEGGGGKVIAPAGQMERR